MPEKAGHRMMAAYVKVAVGRVSGFQGFRFRRLVLFELSKYITVTIIIM